jgi:hypothetical protein
MINKIYHDTPLLCWKNGAVIINEQSIKLSKSSSRDTHCSIQKDFVSSQQILSSDIIVYIPKTVKCFISCSLLQNWFATGSSTRNERRFYYNVMLLWVQHMFSFWNKFPPRKSSQTVKTYGKWLGSLFS